MLYVEELSCLLTEIILKEEVIFWVLMKTKEEIYMVCFPTWVHSCEGVCAHHCYSNPFTAGSMSCVCFSSAYVTD